MRTAPPSAGTVPDPADPPDEPEASTPLTPGSDWLGRFLPWQRQAEIGFWVVILSLQVAFNTLVTWIDLRRVGPGLPLWQPLAWEITSTVVVGALIPAIVAWERRFPIQWDTWRRNLPWHLVGALSFCVIHVGLMRPLRQALYALMEVPYRPAPWLDMFGYELLKDVRTYGMVLVAVWSYRLVLLRAQGEAKVLDATEGAVSSSPVSADPPSRPERFLVRKLRKEFLVAAADIEWVQAQGNYVGLHVNGHDYLLRSTLEAFTKLLDPAKFVRVHRSYVVNLERVAVIEPTEAGDARVVMKGGRGVPCSRKYRDALAH